MVIAIDGPAGAGKSSVAEGRRGDPWFHLSRLRGDVPVGGAGGARAGTDLGDPERTGELARDLEIDVSNGRVLLGREDVSDAIRSPEVTAAASRVAVHPQVREAMVDRQRALIEAGRYVAEGRDIGTVVSPDAPLKVFLTASDSERARRRAAETGEPATQVLESQQARDQADRERAHGALREADDAVALDTTSMSLDEVVERVVAMARERGLS